MNIGFDARKALKNAGEEGIFSRNLIQIISEYFPENNYFLFSDKTGRYHTKDFTNRAANIKLVQPEGNLHKLLTFYWLSMGIGNQIFEKKLRVYHGLNGDVPADLPPGKKATKIISLQNTARLLDLAQLNYMDRSILKSYFKKKIKKTDFVIVPSQIASELFQEELKVPAEKIFVLANPINQGFFEDADAPEKGDPFYYLPQEFLLAIATNERRNNLEVLMEAYNRVYLQSITILPLFIVGRESAYNASLKLFAKELGLEKKIFFLPKVNNMLLRHLYKKASLVVVPCREETSGHLLLEAMATNSNLIASDIAIHREIAPGGIPFFDPANHDQLTQLISNYFMSPESFHFYKQNALKLCEGFKPEMFAKRLNDFYSRFE
jgi:glycosyltransferase involved in cell wall biosynthesis